MKAYEYKTEIRYSEIDSNGSLSLVSLLDLFQNCSTFHSESIGLGVEYLKSINRAWFLSSWQVHINKMPVFGTKVTIKTWSYGIRYTLGYRNFVLEDESGEVLCCANTLWAYVDTTNFTPVKCPPDTADKYGTLPQYPLKSAPRKIAIPDDMNYEEDLEVKFYFIDTNNHMNNSKYVLVAQEYLPSDFHIEEIRVEYKKSAKLHDILHTYSKLEDGRFTVVMKDDDGNIYATVEFLSETE